jgi:hypothetical protein
MTLYIYVSPLLPLFGVLAYAPVPCFYAFPGLGISTHGGTTVDAPLSAWFSRRYWETSPGTTSDVLDGDYDLETLYGSSRLSASLVYCDR